MATQSLQCTTSWGASHLKLCIVAALIFKVTHQMYLWVRALTSSKAHRAFTQSSLDLSLTVLMIWGII